MNKLKIISRVLVVSDDKILLVHNKKSDFWSLPGGTWEYEKETIQECGTREVLEETGHSASIDRLLLVQELRKTEKTYLEIIWLGHLNDSNARKINDTTKHTDPDVESEIGEVKWLTESEIKSVKVLPLRLKEDMKDLISKETAYDPFIGTFNL